MSLFGRFPHHLHPTHSDERLPAPSPVRSMLMRMYTTARLVAVSDMVQSARRRAELRESKSVAQWRAGHETFWHSEEVRAELGDPGFTVDDDTLVLAERFRLVHTV